MGASIPDDVREILQAPLAVTDTNAKTSSASTVSSFGDYQLMVVNSLNQAGNIQMQWSIDGTTWINVGTPIAVAATTNLIPAALPGKPYTGQIRFVYTASVAPGSGTIALYLEKANSR